MPKPVAETLTPIEYVQAPPFCVQIELTEGCNLRCPFCGLNGIRGKENNYKFLTVEHAAIIANKISEAGWNSRIEFAMHGEPSLNPNMLAIVQDFREQLGWNQHLMMTSNGAGFLKNPTTLIDHALSWINVLALDWYENVQIVPKIMERYKGEHRIIYYPQDPKGNPHTRRGKDEHDLVVVQDIAKADKGTHASLNNHAGCGAPKNENAQGKRCAKPFRELSIRWDGSVAVCCNDWRGELKVGNVVQNDEPLEALWQNKIMQAARRKLYAGERDFGPCQGCDALSYRPGLLPDQRGKVTLPAPSPRDNAVLAAACKGQPYTLPVLRPWETPSP